MDLAVGAEDARAGVAVEQPERNLVQGGLNRRDLREYVDAVAVVIDHLLDAAHLALDPPQARKQLVLGGSVAARWRCLSCAHARTIALNPPGVC